jgi:hypothetical protein
LLVDFGSFHSRVDNVINDSFNYTITRHRWNCRNFQYRAYSIFSLIFNEQRVSQIYFRFTILEMWKLGRVRTMVYNGTFNSVSVISWRSVLLVEENVVAGKTTDLPQITDVLYHIMLDWAYLVMSWIRTHILQMWLLC